MKLFKNMKKDNKGFSLVELIIVIAIMAILVGIVGSQVVPYINRSKVAKDQQVLSSLLTDGVSAFSMNAEKATEGHKIILKKASGKFAIDTTNSTADSTVQDTFEELIGNVDASGNFSVNLGSTAGTAITTITITYLKSGCTLQTDNGGDDLYQTTPLTASK